MAGRKPLGPALVEHLDGSTSAKERLELILATIAGKVTVVAAAEQLGISEAMFYKLRSRVLQVSLEDLEPKPIGRPAQRPSEEELQQALAARVAELERELAVQAIRLELAQTLPHLLKSAQPTPVKKTNRPMSPQQMRHQRQARQRRP
jgi:transposase-like protein